MRRALPVLIGALALVVAWRVLRHHAAQRALHDRRMSRAAVMGVRG